MDITTVNGSIRLYAPILVDQHAQFTYQYQANIFSLPYSLRTRICECLYEDGTWESLQTILSFALTCSWFTDPALDVLWRTLPSIVPLLRTLPEDLCQFLPEIRASDDSLILAAKLVRSLRLPFHLSQTHADLVQEFLRDPIPSDFWRFKEYASRVHRLQMPTNASTSDIFAPRYFSSRPIISTHIWYVLNRAGPKPLLPNLTALCYTDQVAYNVWVTPIPDYLNAFLGPSLTSIDLHLHPMRVQHALGIVARSSPGIQQLSMHIEPPSHADLPSHAFLKWDKRMTALCTLTGDTLRGFDHLTAVKLDGLRITIDGLERLGQLPSLRTLAFDAYCADLLWDAPHEYRGLYFFLNLETLTIRTNMLEWCMIFLEMVASSHLQVLSITSIGRPAPSIAMAALCAVVGTGPWNDILHTLQILSGRLDDTRYAVETYRPSDVFAPLLTCSALRRISMYGRCRVPRGDATLEAWTAAWPNLSHLDLRDPPDDHPKGWQWSERDIEQSLLAVM
ncbi:hypothetical protein ONZ51_g6162 [Trametes cubensis]|uniref:F-box domain-containing protein n=1 Tax=Trametes cubensis TaxID=1111947 RepID=A0AAD7TSJ6_9APHY|nr:hypothetical protein ONZ51_g6162 [Trametes cubensis]